MVLPLNNASTQKPVYQDIFSNHLLDDQVLAAIEADYALRKLPRSDSLFTDPDWLIFNGGAKHIVLKFNDYRLENGRNIGCSEYAPIRLFLKVYMFHILQTQSKSMGDVLAASSIHARFNRGKRYIANLFVEHNVLCKSQDNEVRAPLTLPLSSIQALIDKIIESGLESKIAVLSDCSAFLGDVSGIPHYFRLPYNPFYYRTASSLIPAGSEDQSGDGFETIPDHDFFWQGKSAIDFISAYSENIIKIHEVSVQIYNIEPPNSITANNAEALSNKISNWRRVQIANRLLSEGIELPKFSVEHQRNWNTDSVILEGPMYAHSLKERGFSSNYLRYLFRLLAGACQIITLIPTGMRQSEYAGLDLDNLSEHPNEDGVYIYGNGIRKIRQRSTWFRKNDIPIPYETWIAMTTLEKLTRPLRKKDMTRFVTNILSHADVPGETYDEPPAPSTLNAQIACFCNFIRSETVPTSHQYRKTLANFFLSKTKKAPILLMHLFGHKSITMTLKYLKRSLLVQREVKVRAHQKFAGEVKIIAKALVTKTAAGPAGDRLSNAVEARGNFKGISQADLMRSLEEWLMEKILSEDFLITHTPTNICVRSRKASDMPPCHQNTCAFIDPELPDPAGCIGGDCKWALYTFKQAEGLDKNLIYYKNIIDSVDRGSLANQHLMDIASDFVETYDPIAMRIKRIPVSEVERVILEVDTE